MAPVGWINDPNGLSYYNGSIIYFINTIHIVGNGHLCIGGHAVSKDLVNLETYAHSLSSK